MIGGFANDMDILTGPSDSVTATALIGARAHGFPVRDFLPALHTLLAQHGRLVRDSPRTFVGYGDSSVVPAEPRTPRRAVAVIAEATPGGLPVGETLFPWEWPTHAPLGSTAPGPLPMSEVTLLLLDGEALAPWIDADGEGSEWGALRTLARSPARTALARVYFPWAEIHGGPPWWRIVERAVCWDGRVVEDERGVALLERGTARIEAPGTPSVSITGPACVALLPSMRLTLEGISASPSHASNSRAPESSAAPASSLDDDALLFVSVPEDFLRHLLLQHFSEESLAGSQPTRAWQPSPDAFVGNGAARTIATPSPLVRFRGHPLATLLLEHAHAPSARPTPLSLGGIDGILRAVATLLSHSLPLDLLEAEVRARGHGARDVLWLGDLLERAGVRTYACYLEASHLARCEAPFLCLEALAPDAQGDSSRGALFLVCATSRGRSLIVSEMRGLEERDLTAPDGPLNGRQMGLLLWSSEMMRPDSLGDGLAGDDEDDETDAKKVTKKMVRKRLGRMVSATLRAGLPLLVNRFLLGLLALLVGLLVPRLSQGLIDSTQSAPGGGIARTLLFVVLGVLICQLVLHVLAEFLWARLQWRLSTRFDGIVYRQIFRTMSDWKESQGPGLTQAWMRETERLKHFLLHDAPTFVIEIIGVAAVFSVLVAKSPMLGFLPLSGFVVCFVAWYLYRATLRRNETSGFLLTAATGNLLLEQVRGMEAIRSLGSSGRLLGQWTALARESAMRDVNIARQTSALDAFTAGVALLCEALALLVVCQLAAGGGFTVGEVVSVAMYVSLLFAPMSNLASFYDRWRKARSAFKRLLDLFLTGRDELAYEIPVFEGTHFGSLRFEGVTLQARDGRTLSLGEGTFEVRPQERILFYGQGGSGKSQLARLMALRVEPSKGRVALDDRPLGPLSTRTTAMHVAFLGRNVKPLGVTVDELLTYGLAHPRKEEVMRLCRLTSLDDDLEASGLGYASAAQDHGAPLPESVVQICALVRILLAGPRMVVLDDALSALPVNRESAILENVFTHFPQITFVVFTRHEELLAHGRRRYRLEGGAPREV